MICGGIEQSFWAWGSLDCLVQRFYLNWSLTLKTKSCFLSRPPFWGCPYCGFILLLWANPISAWRSEIRVCLCSINLKCVIIRRSPCPLCLFPSSACIHLFGYLCSFMSDVRKSKWTSHIRISNGSLQISHSYNTLYVWHHLKFFDVLLPTKDNFLIF